MFKKNIKLPNCLPSSLDVGEHRWVWVCVGNLESFGNLNFMSLTKDESLIKTWFQQESFAQILMMDMNKKQRL